MSQPLPRPERIVEDDGGVHVGWFDGPIGHPNLESAPAHHSLAGLRGTRLDALERAYRRLRLKRWHYTSVAGERTFFACVVLDAGYAATGIAYIVDRRSGARHEWSILAPFGRGSRLADTSIAGTSFIRRRGWGELRLEADASAGTRRIEARIEGSGGQPALEASFEIRDPGDDPQPVVVVEQSAPGRWLYTHKCYGLTATGSVRAGGIAERIDDGHAGLDFNCGFRPRHTEWNWAAAAGRDSEGRRVGFNLTAHRPLGSPIDSSLPADAADCALWLGGERIKIDRVDFSYNSDALLDRWRVFDRHGLVDLVFTPQGVRHDHVNLGLVRTRFDQPYGRFTGSLRGPSGPRHLLDDVYGVVEQMRARW
jgi:hypothetical protein